MVGSLPLNPSLASALALHGFPNKNNAGTSSGANKGSRGRKKTSIHALAVHPSLPRVAYLEEETVSSPLPNNDVPTVSTSSKKNKGGSSPTAKATPQITSVKNQRLVIQQYHKRNNHNGSNTNNDNNKILAALPMENLPLQINKFRQPKSKGSKMTNQPITLASLGPLQSITFLDREGLFWQTRRRHGALSNLEMKLGDDNREEEVVLRADADFNNIDINNGNGGMMGLGLCLGLQFSRVLVILRFTQPNNSSNKGIIAAQSAFTVLCCLEGQRTHSSKETKVQYTPTSSAIPISNSIVVYGCSDGAMRFHNLVPSMLCSAVEPKSSTSSPSSNSGSVGISSSSSSTKSSTKQATRQATIKSVRGPNGRNDPVVKIVNVDPAYNESSHHSSRGGEAATPIGGIPTQVGSGVVTASDDEGTLVLRSRLLTVCASGVGFLWDVHVMIDRSSGSLRDLNVLPPLVRLDGLGSLTVSPRKTPAAPPQSSGGGFWASGSPAPTSKDGNDDAPYFAVTPAISYDPHRHLLLWTLPSDAPVTSVDHRGDYELESLSPNSPQAKKEQDDRTYLSKWALENGGFVKVWDLSSVDPLIRSSAATPSSAPRPPPRMPPIAIMKLPTSVASAASPLNMIAGLSHAPITSASLVCVSLSKDGSKLLVHTAPLPSAVDNADQAKVAQSSSSVSPVKSQRKKLSAAVVKPKLLLVNYTPCHVVSLASGGALSPFTRGTAISASYFSPDTVAVATDQGVAIATLADGESGSSKVDPLGDGIASSKGEYSTQTLIPSNIPAGPIHTIISIGGVGNRPGILFVENHAVYSCRLGTIRAPNDHRQALVEKVDLHDPMMLCRLHGRKVPWRTTRSTRMSNFVESYQPMGCPPRLLSSPSGRYLCVYWEGEKTYEIQHAGSLLAREQSIPGPANALDVRGGVTPSVDSGNNVLSFAWVGDDDNFAVLRQRIEQNPSDSNLSGGQNPTPSPSKGRPTVELFKLAEVKVDAIELAAGATVAAATTVSLGSVTVRGSDRVTPRVLFGGPSLCVGCVSVSDRSNVSDDVAYFYSRKSVHDERASAYVTIGTSIPYPDLVTWDDDGHLCAVSYGSRVAVYLSEKSQFVLLGSVRVVGSESSEEELPLVSLKFVHGVLYCSTQSSVHAIFLGNIEDNDTVCELDAFTIATDGVPLYGIDNPDLASPVPVIAALAHPHVLAYHSGGLLVSTPCGLRLLPLSHPTIRIGTLLAANLIDRARKWIVAMPKAEHDSLAHFLIRRGHADLAIRDLNGLSLETYIDLCMRYERTDELELLIDSHGSEIVHEICDWGRSGGYSAYFAIGIYMLGKDKVDCAKKWIAQTITLPSSEVKVITSTPTTRRSEIGCVNELLVDAMKLSTFVSAVDQLEGMALLQKVTDAMELDANRQLALVSIVH